MLRRIDEWLLLVLRMQPAEIDVLDMEDYFEWFEVAQERAKALSQAS